MATVVYKNPIKLSTIIPAVFSQMRQGSTFLSVKNYINNYNETSHFGIVFHVDYMKAVKKSLEIWQSYKPKDYLEKAAKQDLIVSYTQTLRGHNPRATSAHAYSRIVFGDNIIKSVKWHDNGSAIHLWGFRVFKVVVTAGQYPSTSSGAFTLARRRLMSLVPIHNFRQFKIEEGRFSSIGVENMTLTHYDLVRDLVAQ